MTALEILRGAREFLADPKHWRQGGFANYENNDFRNAKVCEVCLDGALYHAAGVMPGADVVDFPAGVYRVFMAAQWRLANAISVGTIYRSFTTWEFNDTDGRQHSEILDVLDKAIAAEEAAQQ